MKTTPQTTVRPFVEAGARTLVALAHPDDEYLIGSGIDAQVRHGAIVHAYIATKGEAGLRGDSENHSFIGKGLREREGRAALSAYGIRPRHQHFGDLPDGQLIDLAPDTIAQNIHSLLAKYSITTVITLGENSFDGHTDHVSVHRAARLAVAAHAELKPDLRLYSLDTGAPTTYISTDPSAKLRRLRYHRSQFEVDTTNPDYTPLEGTVEQPGIQLSADTRSRLAQYALLQQQEPYRLETFTSQQIRPTSPNAWELARV